MLSRLFYQYDRFRFTMHLRHSHLTVSTRYASYSIHFMRQTLRAKGEPSIQHSNERLLFFFAADTSGSGGRGAVAKAPYAPDPKGQQYKLAPRANFPRK